MNEHFNLFVYGQVTRHDGLEKTAVVWRRQPWCGEEADEKRRKMRAKNIRDMFETKTAVSRTDRHRFRDISENVIKRICPVTYSGSDVIKRICLVMNSH